MLGLVALGTRPSRVDRAGQHRLMRPPPRPIAGRVPSDRGQRSGLIAVDQRRAALDLVAGGDETAATEPSRGAAIDELHLHRLEHDERLPRADRVARLDRRELRRRSPASAPRSDAVAARRRSASPAASAYRTGPTSGSTTQTAAPSQHVTPSLSMGRRLAMSAAFSAHRTGGATGESAASQLATPNSPVDRRRRRRAGLRRIRECGWIQARALHPPGGRGCDQMSSSSALAEHRDQRPAAASSGAGGGGRDLVAEALDQAGVDLAGADLGAGEQGAQVGGVRGRAGDDEFAEGAAQLRQRLRAVLARGDRPWPASGRSRCRPPCPPRCRSSTRTPRRLGGRRRPRRSRAGSRPPGPRRRSAPRPPSRRSADLLLGAAAAARPPRPAAAARPGRGRSPPRSPGARPAAGC